MTKHDVKPGSVMYERDGERVIVSPHDPMYSTAQFIATHYWSSDDQAWFPIHADDVFKGTFLTLNQNFSHLNVYGPDLSVGVTLNGEPVEKWETADSERGYVDVWFRLNAYPKPVTGVIRHRLFGVVRFVAL